MRRRQAVTMVLGAAIGAFVLVFSAIMWVVNRIDNAVRMPRD